MAALDQVMIRLHKALQGGHLPPEGQRIGQRLMTQLDQPTRIAVLGLTGSGKTSLINMLLGANLMPDLPGISAVEVSFGDAARTQITMMDGTISIGEGILDAANIPDGAMRVCQQLPDQRLKGWSFSEMCLSPAGLAQGQILDWMANRSDIAIWCSQQFDDRERALWSKAPDHLKDHSFLALTRADRLFMKGELAERIARLQPVVADEFMCLYPVATQQAAAARAPGSALNEALWHSSGGRAFYEGIRRQVEQARTADLDHAYMLLERYKVALPDADATPAHPAPPTPVQRAAAKPARSAAGENNVQKALDVLRDCADELLAASDTANGASTDRILARCSATAEQLVDLLSAGNPADLTLEALREDVVEGEQMLMLLRLERGESAAEDSLTVLLQLKKELSERVAT